MKKVFFIGINGIGMSGLAKIMVKKGYEVYGSDIIRKDITDNLEELGIKVYIGQYDLNVVGMDLVIYSTAIKCDNPEFVFAKLNNIQMIKRGELLAMLMNVSNGIAVAGTHGKTTTSSMLGVSFIEKDPTIVVGGIVPELRSNSRAGKGDFFIAEADESDNSFLYLNPNYAIITNIEADHLEHHGSYENIKKSFDKFMKQTKKQIIINYDCKDLYEIGKKHKEKLVTYSTFDKKADIFADNIRVLDGKSVYDVYVKNKKIGEFKLNVPGLHNISNSLGVIYLAYKNDLNMDNVTKKLESFKGAKRRFDILYDKGFTIVDDYAHHPTEIAATLEAARQKNKNKIIAVFQPHRYSRVKFLFESFKGVFDFADKVILLPIYSAGEINTYDISSEKLAIQVNGGKEVQVIQGMKELEDKIINEASEGEMYLFMGAGDIYKAAYNIRDYLLKQEKVI